METDLTSIIIGLASLATFFVPIGIYQHHEKKGQKEAKKRFLNKAEEIGFQIGDVEILRNHAAIGIGKNYEQLLYVLENEYEIVELTDVVDCTVFKNQKQDAGRGDGGIRQIGLRLKLHKGSGIKLPVFEGKEGTQIGDEGLIVQRWIEKINSASKKLGAATAA
jgi:hypothetical protein